MDSYKGFLNPKFYDEASVIEAIRDFRENGNFSFENGQMVVISRDDYLTSEELFYEFSNYVLGLMKNNLVV